MQDNAVLTEGWKRLFNARKAHYFVEGRSLCGRWMFLGNITTDDSQIMGESPDRDDCRVCWRTVKVRDAKMSIRTHHVD